MSTIKLRDDFHFGGDTALVRILNLNNSRYFQIYIPSFTLVKPYLTLVKGRHLLA